MIGTKSGEKKKKKKITKMKSSENIRMKMWFSPKKNPLKFSR